MNLNELDPIISDLTRDLRRLTQFSRARETRSEVVARGNLMNRGNTYLMALSLVRSGERMDDADLADLVALSKDFIFNVSACFIAAEEGERMNTVSQITEESLDSGDEVVSNLIDLVRRDVGVVPDEFLVAGMSSPIEQQLRGMTRIDAIQAFGEDGRISDDCIDRAVVRASARIHAPGTMEG